MADPVRLHKAIAHAGLMSRRAAEEKISAGEVSIDGIAAVLGDRVDVESQVVMVNGAILPINPANQTILLYKPVGVISTADDPQGRPTVVEIVGSETRLYPVGRLDSDSEGLILLSNDGLLTERVTHPRYGIRKKYFVEVEGTVAPSTLRRLTKGIELEDGPAMALSATFVDSRRNKSQVEIVMGEGRKREVRRMMDAIGHPVLRLVRTAIGPIADPHLRPGEWRHLSRLEIADLFAQAVQK
ncbi:MAG TPA: pseudouridine synthase [Acidimicrobiia bacterium]